jgi:hypothetical protein
VAGDGGPATEAGFCEPNDVALDAAGNMYFSDGGSIAKDPAATPFVRWTQTGPSRPWRASRGTTTTSTTGSQGTAQESQAPRPGHTFHTLRHAFATALFKWGEHPKKVQALLGYSSIVQTMDTYSHLLDDIGDDTVGGLDEAFGS